MAPLNLLYRHLYLKFLVGYLLLGVVVACLGIYLLGDLSALGRGVDQLLRDDLPLHMETGRCLQLARAEERLAKKSLVTHDPAFLRRTDEVGQRLESALEALVVKLPEGEWRRALASAEESHQALWARSGPEAALRVSRVEELAATFNVISDLLNAVRDGLQARMEARLQESDRAVRRAFRMGLVGWLVAMGVGGILAYWTARHVTGPLHEIRLATRRWAEGELTYQVGVERDDEIGELARSANQMARQLAELDALKEEFLANCSHELKTPLTSLREANALMLEGAVGPTSEEQRKLLEISRHELDRMQRRTAQILDLSRIRAGQMGYHFHTVPVADLLQRSLQGTDLLAARQGIDIAPPTFPEVAVHGDEERLCQVFTNLIANAVKFNRPGGRVWFEVESRDEGERGWVEIAVCDSGIGIPESELGRIFERFERGHADAALPGSGLGLAIAHLIVRDHGGGLTVTSAPGHGSRFVVRLPSAAKGDTTPTATPGETCGLTS